MSENRFVPVRVRGRMREVWIKVRFWPDHRWAPGRMSAYVDGQLAPRQRDRMERHVAECRRCRRLMTGLAATVDVLHRLSRTRDPAIAARITASVRIRITHSRR